MPRDSTPPPTTAVEVTVAGNRRGRIVPTTDAGQFAILTSSTWVDQLRATGWLSTAEADAAMMLVESFEASGIRPRLTGHYDGVNVDRCAVGDSLLEAMTADEMRAWRKMHKLLHEIPTAQRHQVEQVVLWGSTPWCVRSLRAGLKALADALHRRRR